jgi:prepilin-type N-terminal cleavage/methylation domain-containing protein
MGVTRRLGVRASQRGFTLPELLAVVAIMGILATIAVNFFVGHSRASKTGEAMAVVQAIRAAEARYRSENQVYFGNSTEWFPTDGTGAERHSFNVASHADKALWETLKPTVDRPVGFGYQVNTGLPGNPLPAVITARKFAAGAAMSEPWYVVQARANADSDDTACLVVATSMNPDVVVENEGE